MIGSRPNNVFAGSPLDRSAQLRTESRWVAQRLTDPDTRAVAVWRSRLLVADDRGSPRASDVPGPEALALAPEQDPIFLGTRGEQAWFAVDLSALDEDTVAEALGHRGRFVGIRQVGALLGGEEAAILAYARALMSWHRRHRFCGLCGAPTEVRQAGHQRRCTDDGCATLHFPRTDPAVIMLVEHGEGCLLGRQAGWPEAAYSTLAGFVEPGESLEEAVAREVLEEVGITVRSVRYHSSQPWPFPTSIMLGFTAQATTRELRLDPMEISDAVWLNRAELRAAVADGSLRLPTEISIARRLVDDWVGRE